MATRQNTNALIEAVKDGLVTWEAIARAALTYMSEDDVTDMAHSNFLLEAFDEEEEPDVSATALDPALHCFRANNCALHKDYDGANCCCCGFPADAHTGCDCPINH